MSWDLKVRLDPPYNRTNFKAHLFFPGDRVSGKVVFNLKDDEHVESLSVEFKGECRNQLGYAGSERSYELNMFALRETLFKGPYKMRASTYEYPFSFQFPQRFDYKIREFRDDALFLDQTRVGPQPLPPTCDGFDDMSGTCSISYYVCAKVARARGTWEDKVFLSFSSYRTEPSPPLASTRSEDAITSFRRYRLTTEGIPRSLTTREAIKHSFRQHVETHTVNFSMSAFAPTAIIIGKPYTMEVTLILTDTGTANRLPEFQLKEYSLFLTEKTDVRVPGAMFDHKSLMEGYIPLSSVSLNSTLVIDRPVRFSRMFSSKPYYAAPTFTSYAVRRTYELELRATVSCLGEESKFKMNWPEVTLYPVRMEGGMEEVVGPIEQRPRDLALEDPTELPAYEEHAGMVRVMEEEPPGYEAHDEGVPLGS